MRRVEDNTDELGGQDSFLDVVTNIVGILILLVMVVGMRSSNAVTTALADTRPPQPAATEDDVLAAHQTAAEAERDVRDFVRRTVAARDEALLREQERMWLNTAVAEAEHEIAARRAKLNTEDQRDFDLRRQLTEAQVTLEELTREQIALLSQKPATEEIECEPTPIGKVVTGKEAHVLLSDDHVAMVPFEELLELMKDDVSANIWRLRQDDELERTIGPINGFRLRYWFIKTAVMARSEAGTVMAGSFPRFSKCYFLPITAPLGEPAAEALRPGSEFAQHLQRLRPGTTVTIWTYPGNYDRLREVKRTVRELGFLIAVRPLPPGTPIGASRYGSESVSE
ncbi:MAG: hypothetical protein WD738_04275 [Pirellulales bacterium]